MKRSNVIRRFLLSTIVILILSGTAFAQTHWVGTWGAAPQVMRLPVAQPAASNPVPSSFSDQTVRMVVRTSIGGNRARVQLSNTFGNSPLMIGAAFMCLVRAAN